MSELRKYVSIDSFNDAVIVLLSNECFKCLESNKEFESHTLEYIANYYEENEDEPISAEKIAKEVEDEYKMLLNA